MNNPPPPAPGTVTTKRRSTFPGRGGLAKTTPSPPGENKLRMPAQRPVEEGKVCRCPLAGGPWRESLPVHTCPEDRLPSLSSPSSSSVRAASIPPGSPTRIWGAVWGGSRVEGDSRTQRCPLTPEQGNLTQPESRPGWKDTRKTVFTLGTDRPAVQHSWTQEGQATTPAAPWKHCSLL